MTLLQGLGPTSALARAVQGEQYGWGNTEELLATIAELVDASNRYFVQVNSKEGSQVPRPIEIKRPGAAQQDRKQGTSVAEFRAMFTN